jgi:hypothetical protein
MKLVATEPDIRTLIDRIDRGDIDLQPDFQRQEVWAVKKKKRLIDTVLRGWSIPPVHLVETQDNQLEVLDGQQRLAALRDFLHNKFSIDGRITPLDEFTNSLHGKFFRGLDDKTRRKVEQYPLRCFRLTDYGPEEPNELFYRLNQPTMLTSGEQRNALYGEARGQLKALVKSFEASGSDQGSLGFSNLRLAYDDIFARILYFIEAGGFGVKSTESRVSDRFRSGTPFSPFVIARVEAAIEYFANMRAESPPIRFNKASVLSWMLFLSRFDQEPSHKFLKTFIDVSSGQYTFHFLTEAAGVFEDRASLRVTDVSSVAYRDFVLNYIYNRLDLGKLPDKVPLKTLDEVEGFLALEDKASFEDALDTVLRVAEWSATL